MNTSALEINYNTAVFNVFILEKKLTTSTSLSTSSNCGDKYAIGTVGTQGISILTLFSASSTL